MRALNQVSPGSVLRPAVTHQVQVIEPGRIQEVLPQQPLIIGGEIYYVRLTAAGQGTVAELHAVGVWPRKIRPFLAQCA